MFLKLCIFAFFLGVSQSAPPDVEWYHFGLIADMDKKAISKSDPTTFNSDLKIDELQHNTKTDKYTYVISRVKKPVTTRFAYKGRGAELSEIVVFKNRLYTFDDKSGITFRLTKDGELHPWVILANGNGDSQEGYKAEWATKKGDAIYVGSTGVVFRDRSGKLSTKALWIKKISKDGAVTSIDWTDIYQKIRNAAKIPNGFIWHEAATWSDIFKKWVFMPRKCSKDPLSQDNEETTGCNKIIIADENFNDIQVFDIKDTPKHSASGFSAFRFIPGTYNNRILALRTIEQGKTVETSVVVINIRGRVFMNEKKLYDDKYEGLAFFGGVRKNKS
uniref:LolApy n=1 Tax=Bichromomyia olmeca TaxID=715919 RepID=A0A1B1V3I8_9DIPT|nr:LolApy [Bichromomyia olmeca]